MKNALILCFLFLAFSTQAQQAGKAGELLKNEMKKEEVQTFRGSDSERRNTNERDRSKYGNSRQTNGPRNNSFRWNYNYGNAEVFLRIPENGRFTVEIGDQMMSNPSGKFRFFDLRAGSIPVSIYENNFLIYRTRLIVKNNTRMVLDFFGDYGLYLLGYYPLQNRAYGVNEWDDIWNNPYANQNNSWNSRNGETYDGELNDQEFNRLLSALDKESFDDNKLSMINSVATNANFSSRQIKELVKRINFEDSKLLIAKQLYANCIDKRNYYLVNDAFKFSSSKSELSEYISR